MVKTNFSADEMKIFDLANDLARGDFSLHVDKEKVTRADLENYLRDKINNDILKGATLYQAYRRNNIVLFEIIEEIVNLTISNDFAEIPFIDAFVEFKNRALGDKTAWYSEGKSYVTVASFAGNHWDTNREALDAGAEYTLEKEWVYIHVYDEFERFLLGIASLERLTDVIYKSFNKYIKERTYVMFALGSAAFVLIALFQNRTNPAAILAPLQFPTFWVSLVYLAVISSVCAFLLLNYAMNYISVAKVSIFANFSTVISVLAGIFIMGDSFSPIQLIGIVIIALSVFGVSLPQKVPHS